MYPQSRNYLLSQKIYDITYVTCRNTNLISVNALQGVLILKNYNVLLKSLSNIYN